MSKITYAGGPSIEEVRSRVKSGKIYKLSSNENPLGPSPLAVAAIRQATPDLNLYPARDDGRLCTTLAQFHGRDLTADHFTTAVGGVELLELIARAFLKAGDKVIVCPPTFGWYVRSTEKLGVQPIFVPLVSKTFALDVAAVLTAVTDHTRLLYICNPNNPTGATVAAADMAQLISQLPAHVTLIADEVYHHFVENEDYPDSIQSVLARQNVIILHTFSKGYGLAGLRLGYAIAKPSLIAQIRQVRRPFHSSRLALAAGIAALKDDDHLQKTINLVNEGKRYLYGQFEQLGLDYWPSAGNFVLIRPSLDETFFYNQLIERGLMIRSTKANGLPGHFRVTVGLPEANQAFVAALTEILI